MIPPLHRGSLCNYLSRQGVLLRLESLAGIPEETIEIIWDWMELYPEDGGLPELWLAMHPDCLRIAGTFTDNGGNHLTEVELVGIS